MNGYELTRDWFDFRFENPDKCKPIHTELYIYLVDQWNRLGQVNKFGLPTQYTMQVLNINSYNTFKAALDSLIEFGFIKVISESKNQHQSRIIALSNNDKANSKALDKANAKALYKALYEATDTIIEQKNNRTKEPSNIENSFAIYISFFNKTFDKDFSVDTWTKKAFAKYKAVLKRYPTQSEFGAALAKVCTVIKQSQYHKDENYKYITPEFIVRPDNWEKFLNTEIKINSKKEPRHEYTYNFDAGGIEKNKFTESEHLAFLAKYKNAKLVYKSKSEVSSD